MPGENKKAREHLQLLRLGRKRHKPTKDVIVPELSRSRPHRHVIDSLKLEKILSLVAFDCHHSCGLLFTHSAEMIHNGLAVINHRCTDRTFELHGSEGSGMTSRSKAAVNTEEQASCELRPSKPVEA